MTRREVTENKGKEPSRSDNVVYVQSAKDWSQCCICRPDDSVGHYCQQHTLDNLFHDALNRIPEFQELREMCRITMGSPNSEQNERMNVLADNVNAIVAQWPADLSRTPISPSDANLTPADAILRDDEK